jgi:hypothetical protein
MGVKMGFVKSVGKFGLRIFLCSAIGICGYKIGYQHATQNYIYDYNNSSYSNIDSNSYLEKITKNKYLFYDSLSKKKYELDLSKLEISVLDINDVSKPSIDSIMNFDDNSNKTKKKKGD